MYEVLSIAVLKLWSVGEIHISKSIEDLGSVSQCRNKVPNRLFTTYPNRILTDFYRVSVKVIHRLIKYSWWNYDS